MSSLLKNCCFRPAPQTSMTSFSCVKSLTKEDIGKEKVLVLVIIAICNKLQMTFPPKKLNPQRAGFQLSRQCRYIVFLRSRIQYKGPITWQDEGEQGILRTKVDGGVGGGRGGLDGWGVGGGSLEDTCRSFDGTLLINFQKRSRRPSN